MAKKKFYAVRKGHEPGIYTQWSEAERQVKGFGGAQFKSFPTRVEAEKYLIDGPAPVKKGVKQTKKLSSEKPADGECHIYTDGGAIGNPGPGGYGIVLLRGEVKKEWSKGYRLTTNNRMELLACIVALKKFEKTGEKITLFSDSSYVVNGMSKGWVKTWKKNGWRKSDKQPVLNQDLWQEIYELAKDFDITFRWVKGHAGNEYNERCDKLANSAARGTDLAIDAYYEKSAQ